MGRNSKIWLATLFALLAWSMTLGQGAAADPPSKVLLALTKDAAVGERAELVARVIGPDGKPMEGVRVTFSAEMTFQNTFDAVTIREVVTDGSGVARAFYIPRTDGEIKIAARVGNPEEGDLKAANGVLTVRPGGHLFHLEGLVHKIRGRWDWVVQWGWLVVLPAGAFAAYLFAMGLLGLISQDNGVETTRGVIPWKGRLLAPVGGAVAIVAVASVLIVGITLRPWASTNSGWRTELNLLHTVPADYDRTTVTVVGDEPSQVPWQVAGGQRTTSDSYGSSLYVGHGCARCHGLALEGGVVGPDLSDVTPSDVRKALKNGPKGMPSFRSLSQEEIDALIVFLTEEKPMAAQDAHLSSGGTE